MGVCISEEKMRWYEAVAQSTPLNVSLIGYDESKNDTILMYVTQKAQVKLIWYAFIWYHF